ncbi:MAG: hypothetical protein QNJ53_21680 [Pleurocapsa sp. MO_192.B19]|nr:hypothetical protein [Pleurocapsa sp. MO_192.B19]
MNINNTCPCCSGSMLRHIGNQRSYWFCSHCRQEMPHIDNKAIASKETKIKFNSSLIKAKLSSEKATEAIATV